LVDHFTGIAVGAAVKEVSLDAVEHGVGKVFPAECVERSEDSGIWCMGLEGSKAVHRSTSEPVRCVDDNLAVELRSVGGDCLILVSFLIKIQGVRGSLL
jgi:hypothetical protein